jgi:HSP20 family protein
MKLIRYEYPQSPSVSAFNRLFDLGAPTVERFGSLFDDFFAGADQPAVDLYEDVDNFYARLELPGVKKDAVDVELENSILTVSSVVASESKDAAKQYRFSRSITVPEGVAFDKVDASLTDGVLTVTLPKAEARKPRQIEIK